MSSRSDPTKAVEGEKALAEGDKHLSTGLLKWKPDYMAAEPCFQRAARAFKTAGLLESAVKAWRKAADCSLKIPNPKQAVVTLEAAARELSFASSAGSGANNYKETASAMLSEAGSLLYETGEPPRAAELKLRAGKLLEGFNNDRAAKLYDEAASYFDGDEDKDVYAKEALGKVLNHQMALGKHASSMRTMDKLAAIYIRLNQPHNLTKLILSRIVLLLAAADPVAAQREYERQLDAPGFATSTEAGAAEDLLATYSEMNPDAMKSVVDRNVFNYLDPAIARIAKGLPAALVTGSAVGAAHAGESATRGITHAPAPASTLPPGWKAIGGGGGGYGSAAAGSSVADAGSASAAGASKAAARAADAAAAARSALFARPSAAAAADDEDSTYGGRSRPQPAAAAAAGSSPPPAAGSGGAAGRAAAAGAGGPVAGGDDGHEGHGGHEEGDFDIDNAVAELESHGLGGEEEEEAAGGAASAPAAPPRAAAPAPAPAPAATAGAEEEDLGIM